MQTETTDDGGVRTGVATYVVEATVAAILFLIGALVLVKSWQLGSRWQDDGPGAGYFPFYISLLICVASASVWYGAMFAGTRNKKIFVDTQQLKLVLTVLLPSAVYVLGIQVIGIYVASVLFIGAFMRLLGKFSWFKSVGVAVPVVVVFFLMFEVWFRVPLHKGWFNPLSFLRY